MLFQTTSGAWRNQSVRNLLAQDASGSFTLLKGGIGLSLSWRIIHFVFISFLGRRISFGIFLNTVFHHVPKFLVIAFFVGSSVLSIFFLLLCFESSFFLRLHEEHAVQDEVHDAGDGAHDGHNPVGVADPKGTYQESSHETPQTSTCDKYPHYWSLRDKKLTVTLLVWCSTETSNSEWSKIYNYEREFTTAAFLTKTTIQVKEWLRKVVILWWTKLHKTHVSCGAAAQNTAINNSYIIISGLSRSSKLKISTFRVFRMS